MTLYHCHCDAYNWCRPIHTESNEETLWICVNRKTPNVLVPGTAALFCYWKIAFYLEIPKKRVDLFVPPEWRSISPRTMDAWINDLRDHPYEDITLGNTPYQWLPHALVPAGQLAQDIPLPGLKGWPESFEKIPYWNEPRVQYSDGTDLPITINRCPPACLIEGMEKIFCYWKIRLRGIDEYKFEVWVPPEWRRLTGEALNKWKVILREDMHTPKTLGGVEYEWRGDTILPKGQDPERLESQGYGIFNYHSQEDSDTEDGFGNPYEGLAPGQSPADPNWGTLRWEEAEPCGLDGCPISPESRAMDRHELDRICEELKINQGIITEPLPEDDERNKPRKPKPLSLP